MFTSAVRENEGFIFKIASVYTNSTEDRNDLIQEIIYQLWKSFDSFDNRSTLNTWMYRVALNVALYQLKLLKKRIPTVSLDEQFYNRPEQDYDEGKMELFTKLIDGLSLLDKAIIMLYMDDKSHEEIAAITGISKTNVGTKLGRIKDKLKSRITKID